MSDQEQDFLNVEIDMGTAAEGVTAWDGKGGGGLDLGEYDFEVTDAMFKPGKNGKAPQLELTNKVIGPADSPMLDRTMRSWYSIVPTETWAQQRWAAIQDACSLPRGKVTPANFIGQTYHAEVTERTYSVSDNKGGTTQKTSKQIVGELPLQRQAAVVAKPAVVRPKPAVAGVNGPAARR